MKVSNSVMYALRAILELAQSKPDLPIPCSHLAANGKMPERFLLQIMRSLVTHGLVRSTRGVEGGYALVRTATEISLLNVIEAVDGPLQTTYPALEFGDLSAGKLRAVLDEVTLLSRRQLEDIKIADLVDKPSSLESDAEAGSHLKAS